MKKILLLPLFSSFALLSLTGCVSMPVTKSALATNAGKNDEKQLMLSAFDALEKGNKGAAIAKFSALAAQNPFDPNRQTLLALSYQQNADGDPEALNMAMAGYDLALKSGQDAFWAAALAGKAAYDRGQYSKAQSYFARAITARPDEPHAYIAMANTAYMAGDPQIAALAADRAKTLAKDDSIKQSSLRIASLAYAANGKGDEAWLRYNEFNNLNKTDSKPVFTRVSELLRTQDADPVNRIIAEPLTLSQPNQVSVDVAIVLSQTTQKDTVGLNLLDGLQAQYGRQQQNSDSNGSISKTITEAISIPQLTYNLNLFNRFGQYYQVVARPMLTAYRGEAADFFVGRSAKVAVGGVNFAQLDNVDIGTQVKVTPQEITNEGAKLRIEVTRSFLATEPAGNFAEALNTFRQTVASTVEVKFGTTLILSGLSESVRDATGSKTPIVGDTPIVGSVFNKRITTNRRDSVLILVTPSPSQAFASRQWARPADVERLVELWGNVIAPGSDMTSINNGLSHSRLFTRARSEDGQLTWPNLSHDKDEILKDLLLP